MFAVYLCTEFHTISSRVLYIFVTRQKAKEICHTIAMLLDCRNIPVPEIL
jgi:hypothetical protein